MSKLSLQTNGTIQFLGFHCPALRFLHEGLYSVIGSCMSLILLQVCPLCNTVIGGNIRYSNIIKRRYAAVCEVKEKQFGKLNFIEHSRNQLIEKLKEIPGKG